MIDSGAGCSLITKGILQKMKTARITSADKILKDASNNEIDLIGKTKLTIEIKGAKGQVIKKLVEFYVSNSASTSCVLLGRNFMKCFRTTTFEFNQNRIRLGDIWCDGLKTSKSQVKLAGNVQIPAKTEKFITVKAKEGSGLVQWDFQPSKLTVYPGVYAANAKVIPDTQGVFQIAVVNTTNVNIELKGKSYIGNLRPAWTTIAEISDEKQPVEKTKIVIGQNVPVEEKEKILDILAEYSDVFADNPKNPKKVNNATHKIITTDAHPVCRKPYPIPYVHRQEVDTQLKQMLENDRGS